MHPGLVAMAPMRRPAAAAKPVLRRPAQRRAYYPKEQCPGRSEANACRFSTVSVGDKARMQPSRGQTRCCFCDADLLQKHLTTAPGKRAISNALEYFKQHDEEIYHTMRRSTMMCATGSRLLLGRKP